MGTAGVRRALTAGSAMPRHGKAGCPIHHRSIIAAMGGIARFEKFRPRASLAENYPHPAHNEISRPLRTKPMPESYG
jgi:hypothetical protein